jgi:alcohol dehydrogenase (cytochrome c)
MLGCRAHNGRKLLFKMGKLGILWQIDRINGTFVHATDLEYHNLIEVGPESGTVTYRPDKIPRIGVEVDMCPSRVRRS